MEEMDYLKSQNSAYEQHLQTEQKHIQQMQKQLTEANDKV